MCAALFSEWVGGCGSGVDVVWQWRCFNRLSPANRLGVALLPSWQDGAMPSRFDKQARAKAVRLVKDHVRDYESE